MEFINAYELGAINDYSDIISKIRDLKKYSKLIIINNDENYTSAIIDISNPIKKNFSKKDFVNHLPKYQKVNNNLCNKLCTICQEPLKNNEYYRELNNCGHIYHKKCVDEWFFQSKSYSCPLCRKDPFCKT